MSEEFSEQFVLAATKKDGVSVSFDEETGEVVATVTEPTDGVIDTATIHTLAHEHGIPVNGTRSDFNNGVVHVSVGGGGFSDGD